MHVLSVEGAPQSLLDELAREMEGRGRIGVIEANDERTGVDTTSGFELRSDAASVDELVAMLAPRCTFALVAGSRFELGTHLAVADGIARSDLFEEHRSVEAVDAAELVDMLVTTDPYETLESLVARIKRHAAQDEAGAIATFTGRVRGKDGSDDTATERLEFERYGEIAGVEIERIRSELVERDGVHEVLMHHRTGVLSAGQDIVFVVVLAGHREQAFRTVKDGIDRLKGEVPIFKKEVTVDDEFWVHNRP